MDGRGQHVNDLQIFTLLLSVVGHGKWSRMDQAGNDESQVTGIIRGRENEIASFLCFEGTASNLEGAAAVMVSAHFLTSFSHSSQEPGIALPAGMGRVVNGLLLWASRNQLMFCF